MLLRLSRSRLSSPSHQPGCMRRPSQRWPIPACVFIGDTKVGEFYQMGERNSGANKFVSQSLDFKDRSDVDRVSPASGDIIDTGIDTYHSVVFETAPFDRSTDISGLFSGRLEFVTNKKDFDFQIQLYEH